MEQRLLENIARITSLAVRQVEATVSLLDNGSTIPFISRYRKEVTGNLDEVQIQSIETAYEQVKELEKRRKFILESIGSQGKLTDDLRSRILNSDSITLEDLYLPYKQNLFV